MNMALGFLFNTASGNSSLPDGTKSSPEPISTFHELDAAPFTHRTLQSLQSSFDTKSRGIISPKGQYVIMSNIDSQISHI